MTDCETAFTTIPKPRSRSMADLSKCIKLSVTQARIKDDMDLNNPKTAEVKAMEGAYTLEPDLRDELWNSMNLKMSIYTGRYTGYGSWVVAFPELQQGFV
ncbi:hypothetical protein PG991_011865 [Apiospora marii]|uniref:Uncharacterized protein n=1 Tax=Apiospora marii TaxID=335849 RepID=A0ABR1RFE1_9PEZI